MAIVTDPCLTEGLGRDSATGTIGMFGLRPVAWPYAASLASKTGLKKDSTGVPYTDPVEGALYNSASFAGRQFSTDPGATGQSLLFGGTPYFTCSLVNTTTRTQLAHVVFAWTWRSYQTVGFDPTVADSWIVGMDHAVQLGSAPGQPGPSRGLHFEHLGGNIKAGVGGTINGGGLRFNEVYYDIPAGQTLWVSMGLWFARGSQGYSAANGHYMEAGTSGITMTSAPRAPAS